MLVVYVLFFVVVVVLGLCVLRRRVERKVHVAVIATDADRVRPLLKSFKDKTGYKVHVMGVGEQWTGFDFKLRKTLKLARRLRPDDLLMHLDAYDTHVLSHASEVESKFKSSGADILLSTEVNLYPPDMHKMPIWNIYPTAPTRFRWINSGTYIGYAGAIVDFLSSMSPPHFQCNYPDGKEADACDDQRCFHTHYLRDHKKRNIKLDTKQEIFHCMWGVDKYSLERKRLYSETGSRPCVLHGNGNASSFHEVVKIFQN